MVVSALKAGFGLDTRLFLNALAQVSDEHAARRVDERTNSMRFIAAHLVDVRHFTARYLGVATTNPLEAALGAVRGIDDAPELPGLIELRRQWRDIAAVVEDRVGALTVEELAAPSSQRFPIDDATVLGGLHFLLHHEAYHIGQLAILRKHFGYPAMEYGQAPADADVPPAGGRHAGQRTDGA